MVDHMSSQEELNAYWLEKNATSKWDQGHTHYVESNDDERVWYGSCPECRESKLSEIDAQIEFWDAPFWSEEEIRKATASVPYPIQIDAVINKLKTGDE